MYDYTHLNKIITSIKIDDFVDNEIYISFEDDTHIRISMEQYCCESRYFRTEDHIGSLIGNKLLHIKFENGTKDYIGYDTIETEFIKIETDKGFITITAYNEHNGYYSGFFALIAHIGFKHENGKL